MMKNFTLVLLLIAVCFYTDAQTLVRGPYLQNITSTGMIVRWRTDSTNLCSGRVRYGTSKNNLTAYVDSPNLAMEHHVTISGLTPNTKYYYTIGTSSAVLDGPDDMQFFQTAPVPGTVQPIHAWCIGDFGKASVAQGKVRDSYLHYADSLNIHTDLWLWLGDCAYQNGKDDQYQMEVFDSITGYYHMFKYIPFMPAPGNHDYQSISPPPGNNPVTQTGPYLDIVDVPTHGEGGGVASGTELYYSYDYGNVHFVSLNSEIGSNTAAYDWTGAFTSPFPGSPMTTWLDSDLTANTKEWVVAYWHQLPYSAGDVFSDDWWEYYMTAMRVNINPILERHGVDVVLCGHDHDYQRTYMINGHYGLSGDFTAANMINGTSGNYDQGTPYTKQTTGPDAGKGTVYVCSGNAGAGNPNANVVHPAIYYGESCDSCIGSFVLDINGDRFDGKYLHADGTIHDQFTILKGAAATGIKEQNAINSLRVYPNPFAGQADIEYTLSAHADYTIDLFDVTGKKITEIFKGSNNAGKYTYTLDAESLGLSTGAYVLKISSGGKSISEKMVSVK